MTAPSFVAVGAQNSGTTGAVTYAHPSGVATDDIEIAALESAATAGVTTPAAWVDVAGSPRAQGSNTLAVNALLHKYTSGDAALVGAASGNHQTGAIAAFRGVDTTTPVDTTSNNSGNSAALSGSGIITTVDDCRVVLVAAWGADDATAQFSAVANSSLTGVTVHYQAGTTNGNGGGVLIASGVKATAGSVAAWSANLGVSQTWACLVLALAPAATTTTHEGAGSTAVTSAANASASTFAVSSGSAASVTTLPGSAQVLSRATGMAAAIATTTAAGGARSFAAGSAAASAVSAAAGTARATSGGIVNATTATAGAGATLVGAIVHAAAGVAVAVSSMRGQAAARASSSGVTAGLTALPGAAGARFASSASVVAVASSAASGGLRTQVAGLVAAISGAFGAGSMAASVVNTPRDRMPLVPPERRVSIAGANRRSAGIPAQPRFPDVAPDTRMEA